MKVTKADIPDVLIIEPEVFGDERGFLYESYNEREFTDKTGLDVHFVQDNHSRSAKNVLRGLHYQIRQPQGKLVRVTTGEVYDVAVDLRRSSLTFGKWTANVLSETNKRMLWIPEGFAHGFLVLSELAEFLYKTTGYYDAMDARSLAWNDPELGIPWSLEGEPVLSMMDRCALSLARSEIFS